MKQESPDEFLGREGPRFALIVVAIVSTTCCGPGKGGQLLSVCFLVPPSQEGTGRKWALAVDDIKFEWRFLTSSNRLLASSLTKLRPPLHWFAS